MTEEQKRDYYTDLLAWSKALNKTCARGENKPDCVFGINARTANTKARAAAKYWAKTAEERTAWDTANAAEGAAVIAAARKDAFANWEPDAGEVGAKCSSTNKCTGAGQCCGTLKRAGDTDVTGRCNPKATPKFTDRFGDEWSHTCSAQKVMAAAAAIFATAFIL